MQGILNTTITVARLIFRKTALFNPQAAEGESSGTALADNLIVDSGTYHYLFMAALLRRVCIRLEMRLHLMQGSHVRCERGEASAFNEP